MTAQQAPQAQGQRLVAQVEYLDGRQESFVLDPKGHGYQVVRRGEVSDAIFYLLVRESPLEHDVSDDDAVIIYEAKDAWYGHPTAEAIHLSRVRQVSIESE